MVKLRVAARIIPESDYNAAQSTQPTERKFLVVVRNPEEWYIGTLAVEVQNTYKRIYKQDLGRIKYLKDADDFDLDPEQFVSDIFVNEGKADRDGLDQEATIKVVQEQGQAVRQGSVVPDLTPVHYQKRPLPPVPRFNEVPQTLGKRNHDFLNGRDISAHRYGSKRLRQAEIDETQDEDELLPSVERSPELVEETQTSQADRRRADIKLESPGLPRSFRDVAPANEDELELLPEAPPNFPNNRRKYVLGGEHLTPRTNGVLQNPARRSSAANLQSQLPITPPTDPAVADPTPRRRAVNGTSHGSRSPALGASSTVSKFKSARQNLYEMAESDIEDSQMSPVKDSLPVPRLVKKMSSIVDMPSQQQSSYESFNAQAALDPMDLDEEANTTQAFIAEKRHSVSMHNDFGDRARKAAAARRDASDDEVEIPATASDPKQDKSSQGAEKTSKVSTSTDGEPQIPIVHEAKNPKSTAKETELRPNSAGTDASNTQAPSEEQLTQAERKKRKNQKKRAKRSEKKEQEEQERETKKPSIAESSSPSRRESTGGSSTNKASTLSSGKRSIFDAGKKTRRSPQLDSPGEQLSQALQESARKPSFSEVRSKLANTEEKDESRLSTSGSGSTNANTSTTTSRRSSSGTTGSSPGRLGLGITNIPRKKRDQDTGKQEKKRSSDLTLVEKLRQAKEDAESSKTDSKTSDDVTSVEKETVVPSVEGSGKGGRPAKACKSLETQCGVLMDKGRQCGRAIDCNVHRVTAKRAVPGRSKPFDTLLAEYKAEMEKGKGKDKESTPKLSLPNWASEETPATTDKTPALPRKAFSSTSKSSSTTAQAPSRKAKTPSATAKTDPATAKTPSSKVIPPWMTTEEYERMMKTGENTESEGKTKEKQPAKEMPKSVPPPPEIKVSEEDGSELSSSSESESEGSEFEGKKKAAPEKKSTKQTPAEKKATKDDMKLKTPKPANLQRESTTPGSDFDEITSKLKSINHAPSSDAAKLQPVAPKSTLKKKASSDRRSSAASSEPPKSELNKPTPSIASSSASKPSKLASAKGGKTAEKATPQTAKTTPRPAALAASSTSSLNRKASPVTASMAPPISNLRKLHESLKEKSREASKRSSPTATPQKSLSLSGQGQKKVFDDSDESSSSESESSSSDDNDDGKKVKSKRASKGKGKGSPSAVPDRSIRDPTPDDDSSDEE